MNIQKSGRQKEEQNFVRRFNFEHRVFISSVALTGIGLNKTDQYSGQRCDTARSVQRHTRQELSPGECDEREEGRGNGVQELRHGKGHDKESAKGSVQKKAVMMTGQRSIVCQIRSGDQTLMRQ